MADLRLLSSPVVIALILISTTGCAIGPIWAPRLEGEVLDRETGKPIEGAGVFANYESQALVGLLPTSPYDFDFRWATTDAAGRFVIPGHIALTLRPLARTHRYPSVRVIHPDYGNFAFEWKAAAPWRELELRIARDTLFIEHVSHPRNWNMVCRGLATGTEDSRQACDRACEIWYGSVEICYDGGMPR